MKTNPTEAEAWMVSLSSSCDNYKTNSATVYSLLLAWRERKELNNGHNSFHMSQQICFFIKHAWLHQRRISLSKVRLVMSGLAGLSLSSRMHILGKIPPLTRGLRPQMTLMAASHDDTQTIITSLSWGPGLHSLIQFIWVSGSVHGWISRWMSAFLSVILIANSCNLQNLPSINTLHYWHQYKS